MKKTIVSAILGLAAIASVQAQSAIVLYSNPSVATINYGAGSGGTLGNGVGAGFTVGVYYITGSSAAAVNTIIGGATTQGGLNNGTMTTSGLTLGVGSGATVATEGAGEYYSVPQHTLAGVANTGSPTVTIVLVAYNGASYETSGVRGHSAAFTMTAVSAPGFPLNTGDFANTFAVAIVPEPTTFALAGLGLAGLVIFRRRK